MPTSVDWIIENRAILDVWIVTYGPEIAEIEIQYLDEDFKNRTGRMNVQDTPISVHQWGGDTSNQMSHKMAEQWYWILDAVRMKCPECRGTVNVDRTTEPPTFSCKLRSCPGAKPSEPEHDLSCLRLIF